VDACAGSLADDGETGGGTDAEHGPRLVRKRLSLGLLDAGPAGSQLSEEGVERTT
jgi:hypothetical protein